MCRRGLLGGGWEGGEGSDWSGMCKIMYWLWKAPDARCLYRSVCLYSKTALEFRLLPSLHWRDVKLKEPRLTLLSLLGTKIHLTTTHISQCVFRASLAIVVKFVARDRHARFRIRCPRCEELRPCELLFARNKEAHLSLPSK